MSGLGALATWLALGLGAWAFIAALAAAEGRPQLQRSAERALAMSGVFAAAAGATLATLLARGDVSVAFVARTISLNLPLPYRLAALLSAPDGAVLVTAGLVAAAGLAATGPRRAAYGVAASGAGVVALLAASIAAAPFATLAWLPVDGMGMSPLLQHPEVAMARLALSFAVASLAGGVASATCSLDTAQPAPPARAAQAWLVAAFALLALTALLAGEGAIATGDTAPYAPFAAWRGTLGPALIGTLLSWRVSRSAPTAPLLLIASSLASLGLATVALLGTGGGSAVSMVRGGFAVTCLLICGWCALPRRPAEHRRRGVRAAQALGVAALGVAALVVAGAWCVVAGAVAPLTGARFPAGAVWMTLAGVVLISPGSQVPSTSGARRLGPGPLLVAAAIASLAFATLGDGIAVTRSLRIASGATASIAGPVGGEVTLAHQGISRYEAANAHVTGLAAELRRGTAAQLLSPERREYVDSRESPVGAPVSLPAVARGVLEDVHVAIADIAPDESAALRVRFVPFALGWRLAVACVVLGALKHLVSSASERRLSFLPAPTAA